MREGTGVRLCIRETLRRSDRYDGQMTVRGKKEGASALCTGLSPQAKREFLGDYRDSNWTSSMAMPLQTRSFDRYL
jgi:hypothetical protein